MDDKLFISVSVPAPREGLRWSDEEKRYLIKAVRRGDSLEKICHLLGRSWGGVVGQLNALYFVRFPRRGYLFEWDWPKSGRRGVFGPPSKPGFMATPDEVEALCNFCKLFL